MATGLGKGVRKIRGVATVPTFPRPPNTWVDPSDGEVFWNDGREYTYDDQLRYEQEIKKATPTDAEEKICTIGVCKGKTWDEAKEFIIRTNPDGEAYWRGWVKRVTWEFQ